MDLSVVIPTINSENKIERNVRKLDKFLKKNIYIKKHEIIIAAQTSKDKTFDIIKKINLKNIVPLFIKKIGKGIGLTLGIKNTKYPFVLMVDDDLPYIFDCLDEFIKNSKDYDVVIASRYYQKKRHKMPIIRRIASVSYISLVKFFLGIPQKDIQSGMKLFKKDVFKKTGYPREIGYVWDTEALYLINKAKLKVKEIPVSYSHESNVLKVRRIALKMLMGIIRVWLRYKIYV